MFIFFIQMLNSTIFGMVSGPVDFVKWEKEIERDEQREAEKVKAHIQGFLNENIDKYIFGQDLPLLHEIFYSDKHMLPDLLPQLLEQEVNPNVQNKDGVTPLHLATMSSGDTKLISLLLKSGANPNKTNIKSPKTATIIGSTGYSHASYRGKATPLLNALLWKNVEAVKLLLSYGAHIEEIDEKNLTVLQALKKKYNKLKEQLDSLKNENLFKENQAEYLQLKQKELEKLQAMGRIIFNHFLLKFYISRITVKGKTFPKEIVELIMPYTLAPSIPCQI